MAFDRRSSLDPVKDCQQLEAKEIDLRNWIQPGRDVFWRAHSRFSKMDPVMQEAKVLEVVSP